MSSLSKWVFGLGIAFFMHCGHAQGGLPQFTQTEQMWIKAHPMVQFSIHEKYRPYWDSGIYRDWETDRKSTRLNSSH